MANELIRIGTRESALALWQANLVKTALEGFGYEAQIITISSAGDIELEKPLYEMGITGIFTKNLDIALLNDDIDIAVHSLKDVPTLLPKKIVQAAVLKRGNFNDLLVYKSKDSALEQDKAVIATGSLRRKAQWLNRYTAHSVVNLRGNVNTRLQKLTDNDWSGAIFAAAGLERLELTPENSEILDWMVPAPAQGAVMIAARGSDTYCLEACAKLNHEETEICTKIEREFLNILEGGCTAPIGALAQIEKKWLKGDHVEFRGVLLSRDGSEKLEVELSAKKGEEHNLARQAAEIIIKKGGETILKKDAEQAEAQKKRKDEAALAKQTSGITVLSTKVVSDEQKVLIKPKVNVQGLDFITTKFRKVPAEYVRTDSMIITSQTAVYALLASFPMLNLRFKNLYCVGEKTRALVEERLGRVAYTAKSANDLAHYLAKNMSGRSVTFFCSNIRRDELPDILSVSNIKVTEVTVYDTEFVPRKITHALSGVLFYSPSGVRSYMQLNKAEKIVAFCIGESTAQEARTYFDVVKIAQSPTIESVLELVNEYYV